MATNAELLLAALGVVALAAAKTHHFQTKPF